MSRVKGSPSDWRNDVASHVGDWSQASDTPSDDAAGSGPTDEQISAWADSVTGGISDRTVVDEAAGRAALLAAVGASGYDLGDNEAISAAADALLEQFSQKVDKRFAGFQSLIDRKFNELAQQSDGKPDRDLEEAFRERQANEALGIDDPVDDAPADEPAGDDEGYQQPQNTDDMERELAMWRMSSTFPDGVALMQQLINASSMEDQLRIAQQFAQKAQAAQAPGAPEMRSVPPVPPVDRNNPARAPKRGLESALAAGEMNSEIADVIIAAELGGRIE